MVRSSAALRTGADGDVLSKWCGADGNKLSDAEDGLFAEGIGDEMADDFSEDFALGERLRRAVVLQLTSHCSGFDHSDHDAGVAVPAGVTARLVGEREGAHGSVLADLQLNLVVFGLRRPVEHAGGETHGCRSVHTGSRRCGRAEKKGAYHDGRRPAGQNCPFHSCILQC